MPNVPSSHTPADGRSVGQAARFLVEVRRRPELIREQDPDLEGLVTLGRELGLRFDGPALQEAFRNEFRLRLAVHQRKVSTPSAQPDE